MSDFACSCGDKGARRCNLLLQWAYKHLSSETEELMSHKVDASNFLTAVVNSLNWDYKASIRGIDNDQWSAVFVEGYTVDGIETFSTYVQCDQVEHGLALTLRLWDKKFPGGRSWPSETE